MSAKCFLDTNILVYAFSDDSRADEAELLLAAGGIVSVQVLNEFVNVLRKKLCFTWTEVESALEALKTVLDPPIPLTADLHQSAVILAREHNFAIYDSLIVVAAMSANCETLYTEDMQHGRRVGKVTIRNPFV